MPIFTVLTTSVKLTLVPPQGVLPGAIEPLIWVVLRAGLELLGQNVMEEGEFAPPQSCPALPSTALGSSLWEVFRHRREDHLAGMLLASSPGNGGLD